MIFLKYLKLNSRTLALVGLVGTGSAIADTGSTTTPDAGLQEITVTARRTEENLQRTPVAVTAFTAEAMEQRSIAGVKDLDLKVPNLSVGTYFSSSSITFGIRGLSQTDGLNTYDPAVGLYVDGVYMARTIGNMLDFIDIEQVEVLRGPQGVLFGKDTIGGAINITTRKPSKDFSAFAQMTAGSRNHFDVMGGVNLPLSDTVFFKATVADFSQAGYGRNVEYPGLETGNHHVRGAQMQLRYSSDAWDVELSVDGATQREYGPAFSLVAYVPSALTTTYNSVTGSDIGPKYICGRDCSYQNRIPPDDVDISGASLNLTYDFGYMKFKSISAYRHSNYTGGIDIDQTPFPELEFPYLNQKETQYSQELQLSGSSLDSRLKWITGLYFADEHSTYFYDANILHGFYQDIGVDADIQQLSDQTAYTYAAFGHGTYQFTDKFSISLGGRVTNIKKDYTGALSNIPDGMVVFPKESASKNWTFFNPKLGVEYQFTPDLLGYASVTRGDRSGGFNGRAQTAEVALRPFNPETVTQYEIGEKSEWFNHRLRVNVAAFYSDYKDIQLTAFTASPTNGATFDTVVANAGTAKIYGGEFEGVGQLTTRLTADASFGFTHNQFSEIAPSAIAAGVLPGSTLPRAPERTASAGLTYDTPLASWGAITWRGDYGYTSRYDFFAKNSRLAQQGDYDLVNLRATFVPANGSWDLAVFGKNVFNRAYRVWAQGLEDSVGGVIAIYGPPAEWGITAKYKF